MNQIEAVLVSGDDGFKFLIVACSANYIMNACNLTALGYKLYTHEKGDP